jgi:hypothetical protein
MDLQQGCKEFFPPHVINSSYLLIQNVHHRTILKKKRQVNPGLIFHPADMHRVIPEKLRDIAFQICLLFKVTGEFSAVQHCGYLSILVAVSLRHYHLSPKVKFGTMVEYNVYNTTMHG